MDLNLSEFRRGQGWFILPAAFEDMFTRLHTESKGNGIAPIAAQFKDKSQKDFYQVDDRVAIIPIIGPIMKRMSFLSFFFGGTSYPIIRRAMHEAIEDSKVDSIVLKIDSPGGVVNGIEETGDLIFESRGKKPIVAYADGQMTSAAYWLGSAAEKLFTGQTSDIGSIGVLMVHEDWSRWNEKFGINITYLTAGKYKAIGNPDEPLTELAKETFQSELDYLYSIFINTVARNLDVEESKVLSDMADGRVFIGQQAVDAGLVDKVENFKNAVDTARDMAPEGGANNRRFHTMSDIKTISELREKYGDLVDQIEQEARAGVDVKGPVADAKKNECDRVLGMVEVQFGKEEGGKFRAVVESGATLEQFTSIRGTTESSTVKSPENSAELSEVEQAKKNLQDALEKAGPADPGFDGGGAGGGGDKDYMTEVTAYQRENKCSRFAAMQAVNRQDPALRAAYLQKANA